MNKYRVVGIILLIGCSCTVDPAERNNVGNSSYDQADYANAIKFYQAAQVAAPDSPEAYYNAGNAYSRVGEFDQAIEAMKQALITTDPNLIARIYYNLGNIYFEMSRFDDAVDAYKQVLLLRPDDEDARHNLELAIRQLIVASPISTSPPANATEVSNDGGVMSTVEALGQNEATATLLPNTLDSQLDSITPAPDSSVISPTFSVEDAQRILDAVRQAQQQFPDRALSGTPSSSPSDKDW